MSRLAPALAAFLDLPAERRRIGPFQLAQSLGKGGFAPVWLAHESYGGVRIRTAAVKLFSFELAGAAGLTPTRPSAPSSVGLLRREQITEEARALCRVEHPNVVRFYSLPTDETRGIMGLAMEYVAGTPLDYRLIDEAGNACPLPLTATLEVGIAIASALVVVHRAGLVHRDIKPANVIESAGVYKLIDFGIASAQRSERPSGKHRFNSQAPQQIVVDDVPIMAIGAHATALTELSVGDADTGPIFSGTLGYIDPAAMPPNNAPATAASDLYSLGALLYECVTGYVPAVIGAGDAGGMNGEILMGTARALPVQDKAPFVPDSLARLIDALVDPVRERRPKTAETVTRELEQIRREMLGRTRPLPPESVGPFRGLLRFEEGDRDVMFGRAADVGATLELLRQRPFVAMVGPSGSGKSSLARAGVVPAIMDGSLGPWPKKWDRAVITAGLDPMLAIRAALTPIVPAAVPPNDGDPIVAETVIAALGERAQSTGTGFVLMIDQLEELATIADPASAKAAVGLLTALAQAVQPGVRILVAARRDLLDPLLALDPEFAKVLSRGLMLVSPLSDAAWGDVLDQAIAAYGYRFEDEALRDEIVRSLEGTASAMPLVQFALTQLWAQRDRERKRITHAGLRAIGGVRGALERHAEATLAQAAPTPEGVHAARELLLALTTAQGTRAVRGEIELGSLTSRASLALVKPLEEARLLMREEQGITLAHEALLAQWGRLRAWVEEARGDRLLAEDVERDAERWIVSRDASLLLRKRRLAIADDVRRRGATRLSERARAFIEASRAEAVRWRLALAVVASFLVAAAMGATLLYVRNVNEARKVAEDALQRSLRSEAMAKADEARAKESRALAESASEAAKKAEATAHKQRAEFESELTALQAELRKNINDVSALQALAKRVNGAREEDAAKVLTQPGSTSVGATGLPP